MQLAGAALIVAGLVIGVAALVVLHVLPTGLSPVRNAVSQYGITRYRAVYRVQTLAYAAAGIGAVLGIATFAHAVQAVALCGAFAVARALISWFPMDAPGSERTQTGRWHGILAIVAFVTMGLASWQFARLLRVDGVYPAIATASGLLATLMAVSLVVMTLSRRARVGYFGLIERVFYIGMTAWLVLVAITLVGSS